MIATLQPSPLDPWRQRLGGRRRSHRQTRPLAALGYLANGPVVDGLIELDKLLLVVLYDEPRGRGQHALRLAGYSGRQVPWGVEWGGPEQNCFFKDLLLQPVPNGKGMRLDLASSDLIHLGLALDRRIERHLRYRLPVRQHLQLPKLWAGFRPTDANSITGDGPELADYAQRSGRSPQQLLKKLCREHYGLVLFPLAWVSQHWQQTLTVFVDLERFPKQQVFHANCLCDDLAGYQDAAQFDLLGSRFRRPIRRGDKPQARMLAAG